MCFGDAATGSSAERELCDCPSDRRFKGGSPSHAVCHCGILVCRSLSGGIDATEAGRKILLDRIQLWRGWFSHYLFVLLHMCLIAAKKRVVRLTLTEAAEEIKRLRRFERKANTQIKEYEESTKNQQEQITRLKQQVVDNERSHQAEMAARASAYEGETKRLKTQLQVLFGRVLRHSFLIY